MKCAAGGDKANFAARRPIRFCQFSAVSRRIRRAAVTEKLVLEFPRRQRRQRLPASPAVSSNLGL